MGLLDLFRIDEEREENYLEFMIEASNRHDEEVKKYVDLFDGVTREGFINTIELRDGVYTIEHEKTESGFILKFTETVEL